MNLKLVDLYQILKIKLKISFVQYNVNFIIFYYFVCFVKNYDSKHKDLKIHLLGISFFVNKFRLPSPSSTHNRFSGRVFLCSFKPNRFENQAFVES